MIQDDGYDEEDLEVFDDTTPADPRDPGEAFIPANAVYRWDMVGGHRDTYVGLPVAEPDVIASRPGLDPGQFAWVLRDEVNPYDEPGDTGFAAVLDRLLSAVDGARIQAAVVAGDERSAPEVLAANAHRLPRLRSLFLGFIEPEFEISWIQQGDITPILDAFPHLERLDVRGSEGLRLRPVRHEFLNVLRFETGGLPGHVVRALGQCELPGLEHLELWLGVPEYGGDATVADLAGVLSGAGLPALRRLGLRDSAIQDEVATAVAAAPVVARLDALSLGMGALGDAGAEALLSGQPLTHLRHLDLHHHFLTEPMAERVRLALPGVEVDLSEPQPRELDGRYVAVAE